MCTQYINRRSTIARPGLHTVNSGLCIGFSESILKSSKFYEKYTVYNKKGMNSFYTLFTSSKFFNFSFHHFMKIFLFNLLLIRRIWTRISMAVRIASILASRRLETPSHIHADCQPSCHRSTNEYRVLNRSFFTLKGISRPRSRLDS